MRLAATVKTTTSKTKHITSSEGGVAEVPTPARVEIVQEGGAYFLLRLDESGNCIADTWHQTLEDAQRQADFEFGIGSADWTPLA